MSLTKPMFVFFHIPLHLFEIFLWIWWLRRNCEIMENFSLKTSLILPRHSTCVKKERGYCIWGCYEEKNLIASWNYPWFGRNKPQILMTKIVISHKNVFRCNEWNFVGPNKLNLVHFSTKKFMWAIDRDLIRSEPSDCWACTGFH